MKILIGAPVHQKPHIFKAYLESLDRLELPVQCQVDRFFLLHNCEELAPMLKGNSTYGIYNTESSYKVDETTHRWTNDAVAHVAGMKNAILEYARKKDYDYLFFVDSDLILHQKTLTTLVEASKPIVAEVFWTRWEPEEPEMPNAWDYNMFEFAHKDRFKQWKEPGLYQIGMTGACILLHKKVIQTPTVNYNTVFNIQFWGEDRHFCIRAASHDYSIWLDTHYPCTHLYRESEYQKWKAGD